MNFLKTIWGLLFRLFPCPTKTGLYPIGTPGPDSPVLATCNFDLTVKRLKRHLQGQNLWLLVAESKGVNVWCAAGGEEFNTHSVVSIVKTSGIAEKVNHREIILPPLGAPGIKAAGVQEQTGWRVKWGPVYMADIPRYIANGLKRDEDMKRVKFALAERLDSALGSIFPFFIILIIGIGIFARYLLADFLLAGVAGFFAYYGLCPWLPGKRGITKAMTMDMFLLALLFLLEIINGIESFPLRIHFITAMIVIPLYGLELGGIASTMPSDLDPFLAKLGIGAIGNTAFAGTVRTELLNGYRELSYNRELCIGCRSCAEICPQAVWDIDDSKRAVPARKEKCTACRACLEQCESKAITAPRVKNRLA